MPCFSELSYDLIHLDAGVILAMPDGALVLLLALELEDDRLIAAALRCDGALHTRAAKRGTRPDRIAIHDRNHAVEFHIRADVAGQSLDFDRLAWSNPILFTAGFNHCVHTGP